MFNKKKKNIIYKKIYMPYYNETFEISPEIPEIYNNDGEKMDIFFIRDVNYAHSPYMHKSKYFLWDRFNIGLDTHFYTHSAMLETMGTPKRKYGWLIEPRTIMPKDYELFNKHKNLEKDFDAIFTYDEKILNTVSNAKFFPASATIWYGKEEGCSVKINPKTYQEKNKNISMICSDKQNSEYQKIRHFIANQIKTSENVDLFGGITGKWLEDKSPSLQHYRYQIVVENGISDYYFTEKLLDCFASMTIPIYLGARKIDDFFNTDGIIKITENDINDIQAILKQCSEKDYINRLYAVKENYNRVLKYENPDDLLYEMYFKEQK